MQRSKHDVSVDSDARSVEFVSSPLQRKGDQAANHDESSAAPQSPEAHLQQETINECEMLRKTVVFDAIGVQFHLSVFLWQFLVHTFVFLAPLLKNREGQGFTFKNRTSARFNILLPIVIYIMVTIQVCNTESDRHQLDNLIWVPLLFFLVHRVVVALKYATLSETEYDRFNSCKSYKTSSSYINQMMLFSGWYRMMPEVLYFELGAASARMGERINNFHLVIPSPSSSPTSFNQFLYWNAFVRGQPYVSRETKPAPEFKQLPCGNFAISVYDLCLALIRGAQQKDSYTATVAWLINILVIALILTSLVPLLIRNGHYDNPGLVAIYLACVYYSMWIYGRIFFVLLNLVTFDAIRQNNMVSMLHCMIRLTELMMHSRLSITSSATQHSHALAADRISAILSMHHVKHVTCTHTSCRGANCPPGNGEGGEQQEEVSKEGEEDDEADCDAFYASATFPSSGQAAGQLPSRTASSTTVQVPHASAHATPETSRCGYKYTSGPLRAVPLLEGTADDEDGQDQEDPSLEAFSSPTSPPSHLPSSPTTQRKERTFSKSEVQAHIQEAEFRPSQEERFSTPMGETVLDENSFSRIPRITFEFPQNVLSWLYARLAVQNFGDRFRFRMDAYVGVTVMMAVLLMVYALATIVQSEDRYKTVKTPFFIQCFVIVSVLIGYLVIHCHIAASVNKELERHRRTLGARMLRTRSYVQRFSQNEQCTKTLEAIIENINVAVEIAELNEELKPFRIFGMVAQDGLTVSVITTALSFYSVVFSLVFSSQSGLSSIE